MRLSCTGFLVSEFQCLDYSFILSISIFTCVRACFVADACTKSRYVVQTPSRHQKDWKSSQTSGDKTTGILGAPLRKQVVQAPAGSNKEKILNATAEDLWLLQNILKNNKGTLKADTATGTMVKNRILQNNTEGVAMEGKEKTQGSGKGTEEEGVAVRDTKENATEQESVKDFVVTEKRLCELHRLLHCKKVSLNQTYKKNSEANSKVRSQPEDDESLEDFGFPSFDVRAS